MEPLITLKAIPYTNADIDEVLAQCHAIATSTGFNVSLSFNEEEITITSEHSYVQLRDAWHTIFDGRIYRKARDIDNK